MSRFILSYTSKTDHLKKGLLTPNEYTLFDVMMLAAGWNDQRPDYARIERNVHKLHREHFRDEATGHEVWTRQGLDKLIKSLVAKSYVMDEGTWWFIPNYEKWQKEIPNALKAQRISAKGAQQKATPVANPLVDGTQEKATPVAGEQPPLLGEATPVAKKATPVATEATPVAFSVAETQSASAIPDPSIMFNQSTISPTNPPTPQGEEGAAEEEKLRNQLEAFFSRELRVIQLAPADYRHIRSIITRRIPIQLVKEVVEDVKRAFKAKGPGDRIRGVGLFMLELEARLATPAAPVPTGQASSVTEPKRAKKARIRDAAHYRVIVANGFDPNEFENPDEFAPHEEAAS